MCPLAKLNFALNGLLCSQCRVSAAPRLAALHNRAGQDMAVAAGSYTLKINTGVELGVWFHTGACVCSLQYDSWSLYFFNLLLLVCGVDCADG